jgi:RimJ/RimL family protein N-acetyltransferase
LAVSSGNFKKKKICGFGGLWFGVPGSDRADPHHTHTRLMTTERVRAPRVPPKGERLAWWPPPLGVPLVDTRSLVAYAADPSSHEHMACLAKWFVDDELGKWMEGGADDDDGDATPDLAAKSATLAESFAKDYSAGTQTGDVYLVFKDRASGAPTAFGALYDWVPSIARAELTFMIGEDAFRGKGLGKEVAGALCELGFAAMGALSIIASVVDENVPSKRALERCGFTTIGVRHRAHRHAGVLHDEFLMENFPEQWAVYRDGSVVCKLA